MPRGYYFQYYLLLGRTVSNNQAHIGSGIGPLYVRQ